MPAARWLASMVVLSALVASCRSATEVVVVVDLDFDCRDLHGVNVSVGELGSSLEQKRAASTSSACVGGHVGALVVVPSGSKDSIVGI